MHFFSGCTIAIVTIYSKDKAINGSFIIGEMSDTILLMETSTNNEK